jgi:hypothetical protein
MPQPTREHPIEHIVADEERGTGALAAYLPADGSGGASDVRDDGERFTQAHDTDMGAGIGNRDTRFGHEPSAQAVQLRIRASPPNGRRDVRAGYIARDLARAHQN